MATSCSTLAVASISPVRSSHCKAVATKGNQQWIVKQAQKLLQKKEWRNAAFAAINTITISMPAAIAMAAEEMQEEKQPGKLFDFDATLPIIVIEFLLLMVALDKIYFTPLGDFMDARDDMIRKKLESVKDNSGEIKKLQEEAEALIQAARAETTAALNTMKKETAAELEAKLQSSRERIEKELAQALANLEEQKQETLKSLEKQVQMLSEKIVEKVLPPVTTK